MRKFVLYFAGILFLLPFTSSATLNTGDIVVVGFNSDGGSGLDKTFAVVTLASIASGETFYITDRGISAGTFNNSFTSEGTATFSVTSTIPAGTMIMFTVTSGSSPSVVASPSIYGTISVAGWTATIPGNSPWSTNGDQILIYQAGPTFIFGFNNTSFAAASSNGWHTGSSTSISFSNIPPGLTNGTNAIGFVGGGYIHNLYYSGTRTGNHATLLAAITNSANWTGNNSTAYDLSPGGATFPGTNPIFNFGTLPVHLISFNGTIIRSAHQLNWNVSNEDNFSHYEIEMSADARSFISIGSVDASGKQQYDFINPTPGNGRNYYRLKMVDKDGGYVYSKSIVLINPDDSKVIIIYPNPVESLLNVSSRNRISDIRITDVTGRQVLYAVVNSNTSSLDLHRLLPGLYHVHIHAGEEIIIETITKSR